MQIFRIWVNRTLFAVACKTKFPSPSKANNIADTIKQTTECKSKPACRILCKRRQIIRLMMNDLFAYPPRSYTVDSQTAKTLISRGYFPSQNKITQNRPTFRFPSLCIFSNPPHPHARKNAASLIKNDVYRAVFHIFSSPISPPSVVLQSYQNEKKEEEYTKNCLRELFLAHHHQSSREREAANLMRSWIIW